MRMRKKPNLIPRMERCRSIQVMEPQKLKGKWLESFTGYRALFLEIGCGKGKFTVETAAEHPDVLYVSVERVPEAMVVAMERAMAMELPNVRFIDCDAALLCEIFEVGEVDRIYINFCDPWPTKRHAKRRLTAPGFLAIYKKILSDIGQIHFKTDNVPLFDYSLEQFAENGVEISEVTRDLHGNGACGIMTDYEKKFYEQGIKINRCVAEFKR